MHFRLKGLACWALGVDLEDVKADVAVLVHVRVEAWSHERHLWRLVRVARREFQRQLESVPLVHLWDAGWDGRAADPREVERPIESVWSVGCDVTSASGQGDICTCGGGGAVLT